jgi:hypothetical protein
VCSWSSVEPRPQANLRLRNSAIFTAGARACRNSCLFAVVWDRPATSFRGQTAAFDRVGHALLGILPLLEVAFLELAGGKQCVCDGRSVANLVSNSLRVFWCPPMNEADIWRTAREMIEQYGADARTRALQRAEKLLEYGIPEGCEEWTRVAEAITELERTKPDAGDKLN